MHCVKSVQIWSYFWSVFSCIRTEYGEIRSSFETRKLVLRDAAQLKARGLKKKKKGSQLVWGYRVNLKIHENAVSESLKNEKKK